MQYRPTAAELLDIMAELLEDEVIDAVSGPVQHKVRVAANLARILQREAELGPATDAQERTVIATLLGLDPSAAVPLTERRSDLANRLRHGDLPGVEDRAVWDALVAITRGDLAIAKPGHDNWTGDR